MSRIFCEGTLGGKMVLLEQTHLKDSRPDRCTLSARYVGKLVGDVHSGLFLVCVACVLTKDPLVTP